MAHNDKLTLAEVIKRCIKTHGEGTYSYEKAVYINSNTKFVVTCPKHGDFEQEPYTHMRGAKCPNCALDGRRVKAENPKPVMLEVLKLHKQGMRMYHIAQQVGITPRTVKHYIKLMTGEAPIIRKAKPYLTKEQKEQIAIDRLTMSISEVAKKYDRVERYITMVTANHPLKDQFVRYKKKAVKPEEKKRKYQPKKAPKTMEGAKSNKLSIDQSKMQKGNVKLKAYERVFENKVYKKEEQRAVPLNDNKGTIVYVNISDQRTNDQIRKVFDDKEKAFAASLLSEHLTKAKFIKQKRSERIK